MLASNESLDRDKLNRLITRPELAASLAGRSNFPPDLFVYLWENYLVNLNSAAFSLNVPLLKALACNPKTPLKILRNLSKYELLDTPGLVKSHLMSNPALPSVIKAEFALLGFQAVWNILDKAETDWSPTNAIFGIEEFPEHLLASLVNIGHPGGYLRTDVVPSKEMSLDSKSVFDLWLSDQSIYKTLWPELRDVQPEGVDFKRFLVDGRGLNYFEMAHLDFEHEKRLLWTNNPDETNYHATHELIDWLPIEIYYPEAEDHFGNIDFSEAASWGNLECILAWNLSNYDADYISLVEKKNLAHQFIWDQSMSIWDVDRELDTFVDDELVKPYSWKSLSSEKKSFLIEFIRSVYLGGEHGYYQYAEHYLICIALNPHTDQDLIQRFFIDQPLDSGLINKAIELRANSMSLDKSWTPVDLNSLDAENYEWWKNFAERHASANGTMDSWKKNSPVYRDLVSRGGEISCSTLLNLLADEVIPGPFAAELILDLIPTNSDVLLQLELLQIGMSTVDQWPEVNYDGHWHEFLNVMWKTLEIVDERVKDSSHADEILEQFLSSERFWHQPIVLTSIVALKKPSSEVLERFFSNFFNVWDFDTQSLKEFNSLDLFSYELTGVAPLLAACVLSPNASLRDIHKLLEISTWEEDSEFGLYFWDYICAFVSRGEGSSFWCPNAAWREGFFENGLWDYKPFLDSKLEVECLKYFVDAPDRIDFENVHGERIIQRNVFDLLSKHAEVDDIVRGEAISIIRMLDYLPILWRITQEMDEDGQVFLTTPINGYTLREHYSTCGIPDSLEIEFEELQDDAHFEERSLSEAINWLYDSDSYSFEIVIGEDLADESVARIEISEEVVLISPDGTREEYLHFDTLEDAKAHALADALHLKIGVIQVLNARD
jgi:hypothetical protein